jgi:hypothetical protein
LTKESGRRKSQVEAEKRQAFHEGAFRGASHRVTQRVCPIQGNDGCRLTTPHKLQGRGEVGKSIPAGMGCLRP